MVVKRKRKRRLKISLSLTDEEESHGEVDEVDEFEGDSSSDSSSHHSVDSKEILCNSLSQDFEQPLALPTRNWVEKYSDVEVQKGLVVSRKKCKEIKDWLVQALNYTAPRLLVLGGPPGCGKRSALLAACKSLGCSVSSWKAPATGPMGISSALVDHFESFFVGVRYPSLLTEESNLEHHSGLHKNSQRLLLVEDLPIHLSDIQQNKERLRSIVCSAAKFAPHPTAIILSDSEKGIAQLARLVLGLDLLSSPMVTSIKVQAVTDAMMKRRLQEILLAEQLSISSQQLEIVILSSKGDIRSALNSLQFSSNTNGAKETTNSRRKRQDKRARPNPVPRNFLLSQIHQDATLSTYHAVSKVLNNKRAEGGDSKYVAENILDDAKIDPSSFMSFLHHNYPAFFGEIEDVVPALRCLSDADTLLPWLQDDMVRVDLAECAASIATRGFLLFNTKPIRTGWRPIRGPESYEIEKESRLHTEISRGHFSKVLPLSVYTRSELCETIPYAEVIKQSTVKQWGIAKRESGFKAPSIANIADIAMVDVEVAPHISCLPQTIPGSVNAMPFNKCSHMEDIEVVDDIEEWDDEQ